MAVPHRKSLANAYGFDYYFIYDVFSGVLDRPSVFTSAISVFPQAFENRPCWLVYKVFWISISDKLWRLKKCDGGVIREFPLLLLGHIPYFFTFFITFCTFGRVTILAGNIRFVPRSFNEFLQWYIALIVSKFYNKTMGEGTCFCVSVPVIPNSPPATFRFSFRLSVLDTRHRFIVSALWGRPSTSFSPSLISETILFLILMFGQRLCFASLSGRWGRLFLNGHLSIGFWGSLFSHLPYIFSAIKNAQLSHNLFSTFFSLAFSFRRGDMKQNFSP